MSYRETAHVNAALSDKTDLTIAADLRCNTVPQRSFNGQMLGHNAFLLTSSEREHLIQRDARSADVIHPYLNGREFLREDGGPNRFVLDFEQMNQLRAAEFSSAFNWVRQKVLPDRERKAQEGIDQDGKMRPHHKAFLERWWQLSFGRPDMLRNIKELTRYIACSLVTKRQVFVFVRSDVRPSNLLQVFSFSDDYTFGVMQSDPQWQWFKQKCSKLKTDYRFGESVWNTFPWPQGPDWTGPAVSAVQAVAEAGREVRRVRAEALEKIKGGLRAVYRTLELPGRNPLKDAHAALDDAVLKAYGFSPKKDLLQQLLDLNRAVAEREQRGETVVAPGIPPGYRDSGADPAELVTEDCIRP